MSDDDGGGGYVLRSRDKMLLPRSATVSRAHISLEESLDQPLQFQKRSTQFLAGNYIGEVAIMSGTWKDGTENSAEDGVVMHLADPKPIANKVDKVEASKKADNDEKLHAFKQSSDDVNNSEDKAHDSPHGSKSDRK